MKNEFPRLEGIGMVVLRPSADGLTLVQVLGASYSLPPSCREAIAALHEWLQGIRLQDMISDGSLSAGEFAEAGPHMAAFLDEVDASYFWNRRMPSVVAVPGEGHWIYAKNSTAAKLSPQDRRDCVAQTDCRLLPETAPPREDDLAKVPL